MCPSVLSAVKAYMLINSEYQLRKLYTNTKIDEVTVWADKSTKMKENQ